jgi:hypothetical protein
MYQPGRVQLESMPWFCLAIELALPSVRFVLFRYSVLSLCVVVGTSGYPWCDEKVP